MENSERVKKIVKKSARGNESEREREKARANKMCLLKPH